MAAKHAAVNAREDVTVRMSLPVIEGALGCPFELIPQLVVISLDGFV
jgi:hypothetical protein